METELKEYSLSQIIDGFPENLYLYKDSGSWEVLDDSQETISSQLPHETLKDFLIRTIIEQNFMDCLFDIETSLEINQ